MWKPFAVFDFLWALLFVMAYVRLGKDDTAR